MFPLAALASCLALPNGGFGDFPPPRPICLCVGPSLCSGYFRFAPIGSSLKLPLLVPSGAGRGLKVCSSCRRCVLRAFHGFPARGRGDAGGEAAQKRTRRFGAKRVCPESAAFAFPPLAGVAPLSIEVGTISRTTNRPRGLRLFSRRLGLNEDAAGTLRAGRENRSPVRSGRVGTLTVARVDDGRGAVGV